MINNAYGKDRRITSYGDMVPDVGALPLGSISIGRPTRRERVVNKHNTMRYKAVVADCYHFTNNTMRLYATSPSHQCPALYLNERPNKGVVTNLAPVKVDRFNNPNVSTEPDIYNTYMVNGWFICHKCLR